jgi:hypothetical protein
VRDDGTLWGALYTTGWYWYAHAHWEDDSILVRPDRRVILHRGHPSPQDYPTRIRFPGEPEPEREEPDPEEPEPEASGPDTEMLKAVPAAVAARCSPCAGRALRLLPVTAGNRLTAAEGA